MDYQSQSIPNYQNSYEKFNHEPELHNYNLFSPNLFYIEKTNTTQYYDKLKANYISQKPTSAAYNEIFCINNYNENDKNTKMEENYTNSSKNLNNQIQNNSIDTQGVNYSLKEVNENSADSNLNEYHSGRWSKEEHEKFIEGILKYGNEWKI